MESGTGLEIAVIGIACRFPRASTPEEFWRILRDGVDAIARLSDEDLLAAGVPRRLLDDPSYVKAAGVIDGEDLFDARLFGFTPREAELLDPQHRLFLECAWTALEHAGYPPQGGNVGVYAGGYFSGYTENNVGSRPDILASFDIAQRRLAYGREFLTSRVAHRLDLQGPAVSVQTACSTSLVAVHMACQGLLAGACDLALAGGVTVRIPQRVGYLYQKGDVRSSDGRCRAFDANTEGTVAGNGLGLVVLKRLDEALEDGDDVWAVIKGSAINNDGSRKVSFTAPSVDGQVRVIRAAHQMAEVDPETITFVEAHGTGTALGDPIEVTALTRAFRAGTDKTGYCALGSVKTNIGHLDSAAGISGLIKAVLALRHGTIPPTLHFERPNPEFDLETSPFFVNTEALPWPRDRQPRRAGVSSFGFGGTNAHVVLEEAPAEGPGEAGRPCQALVLSAKSRDALDRATRRLGEHLRDHPELPLADVAYTLQVGRRHFPHRRLLVASDTVEAAGELLDTDSRRLRRGTAEEVDRPLVFLFPGQGAQYAGMGAELYAAEPVFREVVDRSAAALSPTLGRDLRELLLAGPGEAEAADEELKRTALAQPALLTVGVALAELLKSWGLEPEALAGHSIGEYAAACLAGVFTLEDALALVAERGRLMDALPAGDMLSIPLPEAEVTPLVAGDLALAAVNAPSLCVVSGPAEAVAALALDLAGRGVEARPLHTSHAFHSSMMDPIVDDFRRAVANVERRPPQMPYLSNLTGRWITAEEACDPDYWAEHLRHTVRFADGAAELLADPRRAYLELGPGRVLTTFLRQAGTARPTAQPLLPHPKDRGADLEALTAGLGRLWLAGVDVPWAGLYRRQRRRRLPLPTYPFERRRYWIEPGKGAPAAEAEDVRKELADWFYVPSWQRAPTPAPLDGEGRRWLLFADRSGVAGELRRQLEAGGHQVVAALPGEDRADGAEGYRELLGELAAAGRLPERLVHLWSLTGDQTLDRDQLEERSFWSLFYFAQAWGEVAGDAPLEIAVVADRLFDVAGGEPTIPEKALLLGPCRVIPQEYGAVTCRAVDVAAGAAPERLADQILGEFAGTPWGTSDPVAVAYRGAHRWVETFVPMSLGNGAGNAEGSVFRPGGTYLITGGLGGIGLSFAAYLAKEFQARLVLTGRSALPEPEAWPALLASAGDDDPVARKVRRLQELVEDGAEVLAVSADVTDRAQMAGVLDRVRERFGPVHGVIHAAGIAGSGLIQHKEPAEARKILTPKVQGTRVLAEVLAGEEPDFVVLFSSLAAVCGGFGLAEYAAANAFEDAFAQNAADGTVLAVNWDAWAAAGMAVDTPAARHQAHGLEPDEGIEALRRILARRGGRSEPSRVLVSTRELAPVIDYYRHLSFEEFLASSEPDATTGGHDRPDLGVDYVAPRTDAERAVAGIWSELFGIAEIGVHDDFFELGGHSLLGIQLTARLGRSFGVEVASGIFFEHPTVAELAAEISGAEPEDGGRREELPAIVPRPEDGHLPFPLTDVQEAYWVGRSQSFELGNVGTHGYFELDCPGLDLGRLEAAWQRLVAHHGMLRAVFLADAEQQILPEVPAYRIDFQDLRQRSPEAAEERVLAVRAEMSHQLFDPGHWPLFDLRASLLPNADGGSEDRVRLHFSLDILILDGWSALRLFSDLVTLYRDAAARLPELEISFRDYVLAEQELKRSELYRRALDYWRGRVDTLPDAPELPLVKSPSSLDRPRFVRRRHTLDPETWERIQKRGKSAGITPSTVLLTAFSQVLAGWSKSPRFTLNLTLFNRLPIHPQIEHLLGDFTSLILLEVDAAAGDSFVDRGRRLQQQLWSDLDQRFVSGVAMLRELTRRRGGAVTMPVVFTSTLALAGPEEARGPTLSDLGEVAYSITQTPQVWLDHQLGETAEGGLDYRWDAVEELFPKHMLDRVFAAYNRLLERLAESDEAWQEPASVPLPAAELEARRAVNATAVPVSDLTLDQLFADQVARDPRAVAVIDRRGALTYGELAAEARHLAGRLRELGCRRQQLVAVVMEKGWEQVAAVLGILEAGAAYLPIDPSYPPERVAYLLDHGGAEIVLTQAHLGAGPWPEGVTCLEVDRRADGPAAEAEPAARLAAPEDLAYVIYTSGSTGRPKGVMIDHRGAVNTVLDINRRFAVGPEDRVLALSSLSFDLSVYDIFGTLAAGAAIVMPEPSGVRDPAHWAAQLAAHRVTVWNSVPALAQLVVEYADGRPEEELPVTLADALRVVLLSGDWIPVDLPDRIRGRFPAARVISLGGATEASIWSIYYPIGEVPPEWTSIPYGRPLDNQTFHVLDDALAPRPVWVPGELYIGGIGVALGYWRDREKTEARFITHPETGDRLYRTGDLGRYLPDGDIEFLGREDLQVKIQGYRVELGEIETVLGQHPAVASAVVIARGSFGARRLAAYYVPAGPADGEELRRFLQDRLPPYMVPPTFTALDALPLSANGKVDRGALPEPEEAPAAAPAAGPGQRRIAAVVASYLGASAVDPASDLLTLGVTSVDVIRIVNQLERELGVRADIAAFYHTPTVAGLTALYADVLGETDPAAAADAERQAFLAEGGAPAAPPLVAVPREGRLPLSFAQQRLWFLDRMEPGHSFYNLTRAVTLGGPLEPPVLAASLRALAARHETLRTAFADHRGTPHLAIAPEMTFPLPVVDLSALPPGRRERALKELSVRDTERPFDLRRAPLVRFHLIRLSAAGGSEDEHVLLWTLHHIVTDAWSLDILVRELAALYQELATGEPAALPALPVQYADFAVWQRQWLRGEVLEGQMAYWRRALADLPVLELPTDRPRPAIQTYRGAELRSALDGELSASLKALAAAEGASLFMALLTVFHGLLGRASGQREVVVGTSVANRPHRELEGLIGFFINNLVLRAEVGASTSFRQLLAEVRESAVGAYSHQDLPFEKLVDELQPERDLSRNPLFQVMFHYFYHPAPEAGAGELAFTPRELETGTRSLLDLTLYLWETEDGVRGGWEYNVDLFDATTVRRLGRHFETLLAAAVADPDRPLRTLPILAPAERAELLVEWNDTRRPVPEATVWELFTAQAERTPERVAVAFEDQHWSYRRLAEAARRAAGRLRALGVGPEALVAVSTRRTPEMVASLFGIFAAGGAYVPIDPTYPRERRAFLLEDSGVAAVVTDGRLDLPATAAPVVTVDELLAGPDAEDPTAVGELAYVIYTSGSTGRPKGVAISHRNLVNFLASMAERPGLGAGDTLLAVTSLSFDIAGLELYLPLAQGARIELVSAETAGDGAALGERLGAARASVAQATPATWRMLLAAGWQPPATLRILCGGEALPAELAAALAAGGGEVWNLYGPTETTVWSTVSRLERRRTAAGRPPSLGRAIANTAVHLLDRAGDPVPIGVWGELSIGGEGVARGYHGRPSLTAERFVPDPNSRRPGERLYRTGDLARFMADGDLEFAGRLDHQVKVRGHRIELGEIETVLGRHPAVGEAVAIVRREGDDGRLVAFVVAAAGDDGTPAAVEPGELRAFLRDRLPEPMVPSLFVPIDELPLTPNRKVDRKALAGLALPDAAGRQKVAPRTPLEEILVAIWAEVLRCDPPGVEDDFFELGGHSLLATQVVARLRDAVGAEVPVITLLQEPTVARLAAAVEAAGAGGTAALPAIVPRPGEADLPFPLTDVQQAYWVGRDEAFELGNIGTHNYFELDCPGLDLDRLEAAWQRLIDHHGMLRAVFLEDAEQQILPAVPAYRIAAQDLRELSPEAAEAGIEAFRAELSHQVFDPSRWPLFEVRASRLGPVDGGPERVRLHFSLDVLILDGWSLLRLFGGLVALYRDLETPLPELGISFRDYVLAEEELRRGALYQRALEYWRGRLDTLPDAPELTLAVSPDALERPRFRRRGGELDAATWARLRKRAGAAGLTPSAVLMTAYAQVLARWSKSPRFTLNLTLFNRLPLHPEIDQLLGDFTSLVLLEVDAAAEESFTDRGRRLQRQLWTDLEHRYVSGVTVLRELARRRGGPVAMPVVVTSALDLVDPREQRTRLLAEIGEVAYHITQTPQVWLDHQLSESADGVLAFRWDAVEELFPEGLLDDMIAAYGTLLRRLSESDEAWHETISCPLPAAQLARRGSVNDTAVPIPESTLHDLFAERAASQPRATAVIDGRGELTYGELAAAARRIAGRLRRAGCRSGQLVAVVMEKGWEQVAAVLGILEAGGAYLPIDPGYPAERVAYLFEAGGADTALTQPWLLDRVEWPAGVRCLAVEREGEEAPDATAVEAAAVAPTDLAYVIYTSGSTGRPKGVMIDHRGAVNTVLDINRRFAVGPEDRVLALSSLSFDLSVYDIFGTLAAGAAIVLPDSASARDPARWMDLLEAHRVTVWNSVPALMQLLVETAETRRGGAELDSVLRTVMLSGDWIPVDLPDRARACFPAAEVISLGGATEASIWSIAYPIGEVPRHWTSIPYGRPLDNQTFHVLDHALEPRPVWVPGELYIGGVGVALGYWRDPERTAASFITHPRTGERLYRTGDLGRYLPDGDIEFLGREDFQVKIQGYRVELGEIEAALGQHPAVAQGVVVARGDLGARRLVAYYVAAGAVEVDELRRFLEQQLPPFMVPSAFVALDALPLSANGKVDRGALPAPAEAAPAAAEPAAADRAERARVIRVVEAHLGARDVDPQADLLSLGATSVDVIRILNQLGRELGVQPSLGAFYQAPTLAGLVELCAAGEPEAPPPPSDDLAAAFELLLDPDERTAFRDRRPGLRHDLAERPAVAVPSAAVDEELRRRYLERRSHRRFATRPIPVDRFGRFLSHLAPLPSNGDGGGDEKYLYPSAGSTYAVQSYLYLKDGAVDGLAPGTYYYHPMDRQLIALEPGAEIDGGIYDPLVNRPIFEQAAFSIFLIARIAGIAPLYGPASLNLVTLEAGYMSQMLMTMAPACGLGLCPIGSLDFAAVRDLFDLEDDHLLVHSLLGGAATAEGDDRPRIVETFGPSAAEEREEWEL